MIIFTAPQASPAANTKYLPWAGTVKKAAAGLTPILKVGRRPNNRRFILLNGKQGFTLVEVVVALAIIATSLLFLLTTIRQGLIRLESCRSELQFCLSMQTVVSASSVGASLPPDSDNWISEESEESRPGLKIVRLQHGGEEGVKAWISREEKEPE